MRFLFCAIPATLVYLAVFLVGAFLFESTAKQAVVISGIFSAAMFGLGWQVTCPKRERLRDEEAARTQQPKEPV